MSLQSNITPSQLSNDLSRQKLLIKSILTGVRTSLPVEVIAVYNNGDIAPIGYVDIQPLVNQVSPSGKPTPHATIFNVPYFRLQGGSNAVIIDPQVGDIGLASFCDRDITGVKQAKAKAIPLSTRKHDISDAVYTGSIIGAAPTQYVQFNGSGITIHSPSKVTVNAPEIDLIASSKVAITSPLTTCSGALTVAGAITGSGGLVVSGGSGAAVTGAITATGEVTGNGKALSTHTHGGVQGGSSHTAPPD